MKNTSDKHGRNNLKDLLPRYVSRNLQHPLLRLAWLGELRGLEVLKRVLDHSPAIQGGMKRASR